MTNRKDDEIYAAWKAAEGADKEALLGKLVTELNSHAHAICTLTLGRADPEIIQGAVVRALLREPGFSRQSKFSTWFHAIVRNACLDKLDRDLAEPPGISLQDAPELSYDPRVEETLGAKEQVAALRSRLDRPKDLVIFDGKLGGASTRDIADSLGLTQEQVRDRWKRIRAKLRQLV